MLLKSYYGMPVNAIPRRDASRAASCARPLAGTLGAPAPPPCPCRFRCWRAMHGCGLPVLRPAPGRCLQEPKVVATPSSRNEAAHRDACRLIIVVAGTAVAARDSMRSLPARAGRPARRMRPPLPLPRPPARQRAAAPRIGALGQFHSLADERRALCSPWHERTRMHARACACAVAAGPAGCRETPLTRRRQARRSACRLAVVTASATAHRQEEKAP